MQDVVPRKICARKSNLPERAGDRLTIGNVQHKGRLAQTQDRVAVNIGEGA